MIHNHNQPSSGSIRSYHRSNFFVWAAIFIATYIAAAGKHVDGLHVDVKHFYTASSSSSSSCSTSTYTIARARSSCAPYDEFEREKPTQTSFQFKPKPYRGTPKPVLVLGATGRIGRRVVEQLLAKNIPTRALVRDYDRAVVVLGEDNVKRRDSILDVQVGDVNHAECLERAVKGCGSVISACGTQRSTRILDMLPWRLFSSEVERWCKDKEHPYYTNYLAQLSVVKFAERHGLKKIVRFTDLRVGLSSLNWRTVVKNIMCSMNTKYHNLAEEAIRNSTVPSLILRPGQLTDDDRDVDKMSVQVDVSGILPPDQCLISRSDIASLAVASVSSLEDDDPNGVECKTHTLATRWVDDSGSGQQQQQQGGIIQKHAENCITSLKDMCEVRLLKALSEKKSLELRQRPYASAVAMAVYTHFVLLCRFLFLLIGKYGEAFSWPSIKSLLPIFRKVVVYSFR